MPKQIDMLILEDDEEMICFIERLYLPQGTDCDFVKSREQFKDWLDQGNQAKLYLLDNQVPLNEENNEPYPFFDPNYDTLVKKHPKAKVFYTGSSRPYELFEFCEERNIGIIDYNEIPRLVEEHLTES